jgi:L-lactate dehydrogenase complex protein LldG
MTNARDEVLGRIRDALMDDPAAVPVPRAYQTSLPAGTDPVELFAERVADYQASVLWATEVGIAE